MNLKTRKYFQCLLHFAPTKSTLVVLGAGLGVIALSLAMLFLSSARHETLWYIVLRDVCMVFLLGCCLPLWYVLHNETNGLRVLGLTRAWLIVSFVISCFLGGILFHFLIRSVQLPLVINFPNLCAIAYIMAAGVFEMVFFTVFCAIIFRTGLRHYSGHAACGFVLQLAPRWFSTRVFQTVLRGRYVLRRVLHYPQYLCYFPIFLVGGCAGGRASPFRRWRRSAQYHDPFGVRGSFCGHVYVCVLAEAQVPVLLKHYTLCPLSLPCCSSTFKLYFKSYP